MNDNLLRILKEIVEKYGDTVLSEPRRVSALLADLARDEPKAQKSLFIKCLERDAPKALKNVPESERVKYKQQLAQRLHDEEGLDLGLCGEALDLLAALLFGEEQKKNFCKNCGKKLQDEWKTCPFCSTPIAAAQEMPKTQYNLSSITSSGSGTNGYGISLIHPKVNHNSFCFITTAVCESFGKPDDCPELTTFRNFRDNWLAKQPGGGELINRYYRIAPGIVASINKNPGRAAVYAGIWNDYLSGCLRLIGNGQFEECKNLYITMINDLEKKWSGKIPDAFHSNWTRPFFLRNQGCSYLIEDYDLLTTILSALEWRKHNGGIKMVTDSVGAEYYRQLGLEHIWDLGITTSLDILDSEAIFPLSFWAAGKIFALKEQPVPCMMIDTDFIVWESIAAEINGVTIAAAHHEDLYNGIYPEKSFFNMDEKYQFPAEWDWTVLPCNTALLYISDERLKEYYTSESIRFMRNLRGTKNITAEMVFAEQRLLAMCTAAKKIPIKTLLDTANLDTQRTFTHVWGLKKELQTDKAKCREFCMDCVKRIQSDFPEELTVLKKIKTLKLYVEAVHECGIREHTPCI